MATKRGQEQRRAKLALTVGVCAASIAASASVVTAQTLPFPAEEFSAITYHPGVGADDYLMVAGADISDLTTPMFGLHLDYSSNPVNILTQCEDRVELDCARVGEKAALVSNLTVVTLTGSYAISRLLELGLSLPIAYSSGDGLPFVTMGSFSNAIVGGSKAGFADPRLYLKLRVFGGPERGLGAALLAWGAVPLGQATAERRYIGDDGVNAGGGLVVEAWLSSLRFAVNVGGLYRPVRGVIATEVGPMLTYSGALEWHVEPTETLSVLGELTGATGFDPETRTDQLEARLASRVTLGDLQAHLGVGVGLIYGPGVPAFRILAGGSYAGRPDADSDGDGVIDRQDACPDVPEDLDNYIDDDGCPELDNDGDTLIDEEDECPNDAEDIDEYEDHDGCPEPDNDGDGVRDGYDSCPQTPEDMDGDRDTDGCPDNDLDRDGVEDHLDQCPDVEEDTDGLGDEDGCPEVDFDDDGVPDDGDECPEDPEDRDRFQDRDGCPEPGGRIRRHPQHAP